MGEKISIYLLLFFRKKINRTQLEVVGVRLSCTNEMSIMVGGMRKALCSPEAQGTPFSGRALEKTGPVAGVAGIAMNYLLLSPQPGAVVEVRFCEGNGFYRPRRDSVFENFLGVKKTRIYFLELIRML